MRDFFDKVPTYIILAVIVAIVRGVMKLVKDRNQTGSGADPAQGENDEQRRVREIQERIRRIAAERRGQRAPSPQPQPLHVPPAMPQPMHVPPPVRVPALPPPLVAHVNRAELERQERLREQLREIEEKKFLTQRHAAHAAETQRESEQSETGQRTTARARLLGDLRDPASVRRAIVLREVLGAPVGLR